MIDALPARWLPRAAEIAFRLWRWWIAELAGMAPGTLRQIQGTLSLNYDGNRLRIEGRGRRGVAEEFPFDAATGFHAGDEARSGNLLRNLGLSSGRAVLTLDSDQVMVRTTRLPRSAEPELDGVVGFEIQRLTPFLEEGVYRVHAIDRTLGDHRTIVVHLAVVPRRVVTSIRQVLVRYGIGLSAIRFQHKNWPFETAQFPLSHVGFDGGAHGPARRRLAVMTIAVAILIVAAALSPLIRLNTILTERAATLSMVTADALRAQTLEREIERATRGIRAAAASKNSGATPLAILDELSGIIPDGTWLDHLSIERGSITIEGHTNASASLVPLLEASPMFDRVSYLSPVTRSLIGGGERFGFVLKLRKMEVEG